jgi:general secretion pathway protein D
MLCAAPPLGSASPAPDDEDQEDGTRRARPVAKPRRGAAGQPGKAMISADDLKSTVMSKSKGKVVSSTKPGQKKGSGGSGDDEKKGGGKGEDDKEKKGGGGKGGEGGASPWSSVNLPQELAVGIEYQKPKKGTKFAFNLVDADLIELIKIIGNITGKSFILGGKVPNIKATIYAPTQITAGEAYQAFLSVLQVNGLTVIPAGRYLKILAVGGSTGQNTPIVKGKGVPPGDQIVTRLHRLEHVSADELAALLDRFKSPDGDITVYAPSNMLIITDYGSSIRRLLKLVKLLDVPGIGEQIWIEPINYADASELADRIIEIFDVGETAAPAAKAKPKKGKKKPKKGGRDPGRSGASSSGPSVFGGDDDSKISKILADERTNSLIIVSSEASYLRILELVKQLDVPIAGEGTLHVHKLQHADADELAKVLNELSRGSRGGGKKGKGGKGGGEGAASLFEGEMQISADKATNSLVIVASLRDYLSLKSVIDALDTMKRQVYVEAVIMEVSLDKNRDLGFAFHMGNTFDTRGDSSLIYGSSQPTDQMSSLMLGPGALSGLAAGIRGPDLEGTEDLLGPGISIPAFGVVLQALQTNSDVNVLSTPHILATDNVEAAITVGENVPVQQGFNPAGALLSSALGGARSGGTQGTSGLGALGAMGGMGGMGGFGYSIGRQNVGLTLKITPFINDDDQVRLEIDLEISEVKSVDSSMGPNISKQNAVTTSVVADQQTIVIGGLITDNQVETTHKVPVLGDIPIIGFFFRHKTSLIKKRNLLIFLTPYIVRGPDDFREIFNRKMAERREFIERYTAFEYHRYDPHLDWSRTNGAVAVINEVIAEAEEDERLRALSEIDDEVEHTPKPPIQFPKGVKFNTASGGDDSGSSPALPVLGTPVRVEAGEEE